MVDKHSDLILKRMNIKEQLGFAKARLIGKRDELALLEEISAAILDPELDKRLKPKIEMAIEAMVRAADDYLEIYDAYVSVEAELSAEEAERV